MTKEELKEIEDLYIQADQGGPVNTELVIKLARGIASIGRLLKYIKELESQIPMWIPVDERLPEDSGYYLCWDIGIMESDESCLFIYYFDANLKEFAPGADVLITYWMPIPKGPEEK